MRGSKARLFRLFLTGNAARRLWRGVQTSRRNLHPAVDALAVAAVLNAAQRGLHLVEFFAFPRVQGKFQFACGVGLGRGVFVATKVFGGGFGPANVAAAQRFELLLKAGPLGQ